MDASSSTVRLSSQRLREYQTEHFYDALTLMRTLTPSFEPHAVAKTDWHRFLDYLSWLCDSKCGGRTVTSIAVEWSEGAARFWVARNGATTGRHVAHLESLLASLVGLNTDSDDTLEAATRSVFVSSIDLSNSRVHNYTRHLRRHVACVERQICSDEDKCSLCLVI